jgi:hypothetical protein
MVWSMPTQHGKEDLFARLTIIDKGPSGSPLPGAKADVWFAFGFRSRQDLALPKGNGLLEFSANCFITLGRKDFLPVEPQSGLSFLFLLTK